MSTRPREADWPASLRGVVPEDKVEFAVRGRRFVSLPLARRNKGLTVTILVVTAVALGACRLGFDVPLGALVVSSREPWFMGLVAGVGVAAALANLAFAHVGPRLPGRFYVATPEGLVEARRRGYRVWPWRGFATVSVQPDGTVVLATVPKVIGRSRRGRRPSTAGRIVELVEVPEAEAVAARCRDLIARG